MKRRICLVLPLLLAAMASAEEGLPPHPFPRGEHKVIRMEGEAEAASLPANLAWVSDDWGGENAQMPYLAYLPEKQRLLLLAECGQPIHSALLESADGGVSWGKRRWLHLNAEGQPDAVGLGLTNLGNGTLRVYSENMAAEWESTDFGATWSPRSLPPAEERYSWDPLLVLPSSDGGPPHLAQAWWRPTGVPWGSDEAPYSQAWFRSSPDGGATWAEDRKVPQWLGVNEVCLLRAANGDWVAACRTDNPKRFAKTQFDHYSGLAISISKDEGQTWSALNPLHEWGRHHPSLVLLPDGRILMTYVVRLGYPDAPDGYPQFGVEAVLSPDNGATWDLEHRYILARWTGNILGPNAWFCSVQSSSTVLLPDGALVTAFGTGFRNAATSSVCKMDIAVLRWHLER